MLVVLVSVAINAGAQEDPGTRGPAESAPGQEESVMFHDGVEQLDETHPLSLARSRPEAALVRALRSLSDSTLPVEGRTENLVIATALGRHRKDQHRVILATASRELAQAASGVSRKLDAASIAYLLAAYDAVLLASPTAETVWSHTRPMLDQLRGTGVEYRVIGRLSSRYKDLSIRAATYMGGPDAPVPGLRDTVPDFDSFEDPDDAAVPEASTNSR